MTPLHRLRRRALTLLAVTTVAAAGGGAALAAGAAGQDSSAVAVNTKDGSSVFKLTFQIRRVMGDTVTNQNAAVAYASCTECQTVAISIQVLLVSGNPEVFSPENYAISINEACNLCDTLASAYQFAVGVGTKLRLTGDGRRSIAGIRTQLRELQRSGLSGPEIQQRVDALMDELAEVLRTQLVAVKPDDDNDEGDEHDNGEHDNGEDEDEDEQQPAQTSPPPQTAPPAETVPPAQTTPTETTPAQTTPDTTTTP